MGWLMVLGREQFLALCTDLTPQAGTPSATV